MAVSSSASAPRSSARFVEEERRHSPIPYRVGPLDYFPPVTCYCGQKAALWISWSDENPGQRYIKCYKAREGGCKLYEWYEGHVDSFVATLLVNLRNAVWSLKKQRVAMRDELAKPVAKLEAKEKEANELTRELVVAKDAKDELTRELVVAKDAKDELRAMLKKVQMQMMMMGALCGFVVAGVALIWVR